MRITKHCEECNSEDIRFDGDIEWSPKEGRYRLLGVSVEDQAFCTKCDDQVFVKEIKHDAQAHGSPEADD